MTEVLDQDFLEMSLADVSDLLLDKLHESKDKKYSLAKLLGSDVYGKRYELVVVLKEVDMDE